MKCEDIQTLLDALRANGVFHTPLALRRKGGKPWDEYEIDAIRRTRDAVALAETLLAQPGQNSDDAQLVANAVRAARPRRAAPAERWVAVKETFMVGSTTARSLCRRFDLDPDEEVCRGRSARSNHETHRHHR